MQRKRESVPLAIWEGSRRGGQSQAGLGLRVELHALARVPSNYQVCCVEWSSFVT